MKKSRLFFSVLITTTMMLSLFSLSVLAQPPLPDNPYGNELDSGANYLGTDAFEINIQQPQYWQGRTITVELTKTSEVTLDVSQSVVFSISTNLPNTYRDWVGLDYNPTGTTGIFNLYDKNGNEVTAENHVTFINDLDHLDPDNRLFIEITPGAPWGPLGFYQPEIHFVRLGFFIDDEVVRNENLNEWLRRSNVEQFRAIDENLSLGDSRDDALYFEGDSMEFSIFNLPIGYTTTEYIANDAYPGPNIEIGKTFSHIRVHTVVCEQPNSECETAPIFTNQENAYIDFSGDQIGENQSVTLQGDIDPALGRKFVGYVVELRTVESSFAADPKNLIATYSSDYHIIGVWEDGTPGSKLVYHPDHIEGNDPSEHRYVIINFDVPVSDDIILPDFKEFSNLYSTDKPTTFTKTGLGSINFDPGLNIINNRDQFTLLSEAIKIEKDETGSKLSAQVDTSVLSFLSNTGATIIFENAMETLGFESVDAESFLEYVDIEVYDGDTLVEDISEYVDFDNSSYNPETDELSLRVFHFTEYVVNAAEVQEEETTPDPGEQEQETTPDQDEEETPVEEDDEALLPDMSDQQHLGWLLLNAGLIILLGSYLVRKSYRVH